ncbi:hypothetical protein LUZ61_006147 [Rhynchospora tenuis]|uniref:Peptidase S8/S53 domain-containing protein n=1 Tax=Rhynchospora tenuis TaxID=198213 RepID=A0AAD5ZR33_9POAL|nr:hypothetical protein LUZ61_006147 [Rhynchospora tenuis]
MSTDIGSFHAMQMGVTVVFSAGNEGPDASLVQNVSPWGMCVGASTIDRGFPAKITLGNNVSFVWNKSNSATNKIVLCFSTVGQVSSTAAAYAVLQANGSALIFAEPFTKQNLQDDFLPTVHVDLYQATQMLYYIRSTRNSTVHIFPSKTEIGHVLAPKVAYFSSRGPSSATPNILKPDIIAPGENILAAWSPKSSPTLLPFDDRSQSCALTGATDMTDHTTGGTLDAEALTVMKSMTPPLNGTNYTSWARGVYLSLAGKGKEHHLSGLPDPNLIEIKESDTNAKTTTGTGTTVPDPQKQHKNDPKWKREDIQVMTWLLSTMTPEISQEFLFSESAQAIWENARQRFGQAQNFAHLYNIKQEINQMKKGTKSISELIGSLKTKWDIINMLNPITTDLRTLQERAEREKIFQFLAALDPSYDSIRSQILLSPDLTSFNQIAAMIEQEESRRIAMNPLLPSGENQAYTTRRPPKSTTTTTTPFCDHCNREGHGREDCWVLHPHLKPVRGRGRGGGVQRGGRGGFANSRGRGGREKSDFRAHNAEAEKEVNSSLSDPGVSGMDSSKIRSLIKELNSMLPDPDPTQTGEVFSVSCVSQFMHAPRTSHLDIVNRILRYLKGTPGQGIWFKKNGTNNIVGYSDADWAGSFDRKSTTGYCTFVGGNLVTWRSKKQNVIARSSAEAEYRAMASTACELIWIKHLLSDMKLPHNEPMKMYCDNQVARHIASNPVFHERTKHIEVDCHFIREKVQNAYTSDTSSETILAGGTVKPVDPFDIGAGHINPLKAMDPGLVYDIEVSDHVLFLCSIGYSKEQINRMVAPSSGLNISCTGNHSDTDLNYPAITISDLRWTTTVKRTLTNVGHGHAFYYPIITSPQGVHTWVWSNRLVFKYYKEKLSYYVTVAPANQSTSRYDFGEIVWSDGYHHVRIPLIVRVIKEKNGDIDCRGDESRSSG